MRRSFLFALFFVLPAAPLLAVTAPALADSWRAELLRDHPLVGTLWSRAEARPLALPELDPALEEADLLLLGEQHDNPDHHLLQALVIERLVALGRPPALALEMLPRDRQPDLSGYKEDASGLGAFLRWSEGGWPDWSLYEPLGRSLLRHGLPLLAADVPSAQRKAVGAGGLAALPEPERQRLGLDRPLPPPREAGLREALFEGHCGLVPMETLGPMLEVQRLRDANLADALLEARAAQSRPVALIAGTGHVRDDHGVPWYLARRAPELAILVLAFVEVSPEVARPEDHPLAAAADYLWFTPGADRGDPCVDLERRFGGG